MFVTSTMLEKCHNLLLANDDILFFNEDFNKVTFLAKTYPCSRSWYNYLDQDNNFHEDDTVTILYIKLLDWCSNFEKRKALKKNKQRINACCMASKKMERW